MSTGIACFAAPNVTFTFISGQQAPKTSVAILHFATICAYTMPICDQPVPLYGFEAGHVARCYLYDERAKDQRPIEAGTAPVVGDTV